jgi:hypothetical protein
MTRVVFLSALCLAVAIADADGGSGKHPSTTPPAGLAVREHLKAVNAPLPLNTAKQKLLDGKQIFSQRSSI